MKFSNRPNTSIITEDGQEHWVSRSVAVTVYVLLIHQDMPYILVNKRGPGLPNKVGYWNLVCGYLDYDESIDEAAVREAWEECGINVLKLMDFADAVYFDPPWDIRSKPGKSDKQNVSTHHGLVAQVSELPPVSDAFNEPGETTDIRWLPLDQVHTLEFAFDHNISIEKFVHYIAQNTEHDFRHFFS